MDQIMIDIEDNENSGYFPIQVFETQSEPRTALMITIPNTPSSDEPHDVVGWCTDDSVPADPDGIACAATSVLVGDSGSGQALLIHGGDQGVRLRVSSGGAEWSLQASDQSGEPYLLLRTSIELIFS
jgi:hypothetical protein